MKVVQRGARRIAWDRYGDGPPLMLIPGIGAGAAQFGTLPRRFARAGHTCVVVNPVGIPPSSPHEGEYDFEVAGADLLAVIDAVGLGPCALVAVSMGGKPAAPAAVAAPEHVQRVVMVGSSLVITPRGAAIQRFFETAAAHLEGPQFAQILAPYLFGRSFAARRPDLLEDIIRTIRPDAATRALMVAQARAARSYDPAEHLPKLRCPLLCVAGGEDTIAPAVDVRATAAMAPDGRVVDIPDAGHSILLESNQAFEEIVRFLRATD